MTPQNQTDHTTTAGIAAAMAVALAWGAAGILISAQSLPAQGIVAGRMAVALLVLGPLAIIAWRLPTRRDVCGALPLAAYYVLATKAFTLTSVSEVAVLLGSAPLFALLLNWLAGERIGERELLGAGAAVVGLIMFLAPAASGSDQLENWGRASALLASLCAAGVARLSIRKPGRGHATVNVYAAPTIACGVALLIALVWLVVDPVVPKFTPRQSVLMIGLGLVSTAALSLLFVFASRCLRPSTAASCLALVPLWAALFSGLFLGEWPSLGRVPGALIALVGIFILARGPGGRVPPKPCLCGFAPDVRPTPDDPDEQRSDIGGDHEVQQELDPFRVRRNGGHNDLCGGASERAGP